MQRSVTEKDVLYALQYMGSRLVMRSGSKGPLFDRLMAYEMAVGLGKATMMVLGIVVATLWPGAFLPFFILAAAYSLLYAPLP